MSLCAQALLAQARNGDSEAFDEIVEGHLDLLYSLAYGVLGDRGAAEDACQETYLRLLRALPTLSPDTCLRSFLYRVCLNYCLDERRREARHPLHLLADLEQEPAGDPFGAPGLAEEQDLRRWVLGGLQQLSAQQRAVFVLRYFHGRSVEETAFLLDCAPGTIKSHMSRAVSRLRELLGPEESSKL